MNTEINKLLINGIDHSEFDLEWAKRGGVVYAEFEVGYHFQTKDGETCGGGLYFYERKRNLFSTVKRLGEYDCFSASKNADGVFSLSNVVSQCHGTCVILRMAAPKECEAAGVEYIEKPVSAEELAELRKDSERLEFVLARCSVDCDGVDIESLAKLDALMKGVE